MRHVLTASALIALAACGQPPAEAPATALAEAPTAQEFPAAATPAAVEGWETATSAYAKIGTTLPAFNATLAELDITAETLRGRWTIIGIVTAPLPSGEGAFIAALASAADQDPDLDVLMIDRHLDTTPWPGEGPTSNGSPLAPSGASLITALALPGSPSYLLIGPDLTVEAWRGALSDNPSDGIKPVIWGVAEIRKRVAAPQ